MSLYYKNILQSLICTTRKSLELRRKLEHQRSNRNHKLTLALVWQMLRKYQIDLLTRLGGGKKIQENEIRKWANKKASKGGKKISSFSDKSLRDGRFRCKSWNLSSHVLSLGFHE